MRRQGSPGGPAGGTGILQFVPKCADMPCQSEFALQRTDLVTIGCHRGWQLRNQPTYTRNSAKQHTSQRKSKKVAKRQSKCKSAKTNRKYAFRSISVCVVPIAIENTILRTNTFKKQKMRTFLPFSQICCLQAGAPTKALPGPYRGLPGPTGAYRGPTGALPGPYRALPGPHGKLGNIAQVYNSMKMQPKRII